MSGTRYNQFCALARAAEIVGERWTLLIIRELLLSPMRFGDLGARLDGVSPALLTARLDILIENGIVRRASILPLSEPAPTRVFVAPTSAAKTNPSEEERSSTFAGRPPVEAVVPVSTMSPLSRSACTTSVAVDELEPSADRSWRRAMGPSRKSTSNPRTSAGRLSTGARWSSTLIPIF